MIKIRTDFCICKQNNKNMIKTVKVDDYEFDILVTYGVSDSYPRLETNQDGSLNFPVGYVYMEDYYNSHLYS